VSPALTGEALTLRQAYGIGRYEDTTSCLGRRAEPPRGSAIVTHVTMAPLDVCGAATLGCARARKANEATRLTANLANIATAEKNADIHSQE
jgi:hypothetical protein